MQRSLVLLAFTALILASSTEARRLWQFPSFGGAANPTAAGGMMPGAGTAPGGAGTAPTTGSGNSIVDDAVAEAVAAAQSELAGARGAAAEPAAAATAEPAAAATTEPAAATAAPAVATATATATGTPGNPGAAAAVADSTRGVAAGATGASTATAGTGGKTVTAVGEEEDEPAAPAGPKVMRPGVYVIADPPPPPKPKPAAVGAVGAAGAAAAGRNVTAGPPVPTPGKNLMVVLTLMGQQAKDIYKNQKSIRDEVAQAAGVGSNQVLFFNQTTNQDPRTGVTAMSLIMNVDCKDQAECGKAGVKLFNSSSQTRLTDALARNSVSLLPGTFQVYGVQQLGKYKGNETLFENKALTTVKPKTTETELDYNSTLARVFAGMEDEPAPGAKGSKGKQPAGALPGDIPLAGTPGLFGNFSIPMDNISLPQSSFAGMGNATQLSPFGALNALPGLQNTSDTLAEAQPAHKAKSSAGAFTAGLLPLVAAAAAVLVM